MTDQIIQFVTERTGVTHEQMKSKSRVREIAQARQAAMWLIRKHTTESFKAIARLFGGRDHSTVIHSCNVVDDLIATRHKPVLFVREFKRIEISPMWEDEWMLEVCG